MFPTLRAVLPNPHREKNNQLVTLSAHSIEIIYRKTEFLKRVIEDTVNVDETIVPLKYLSWENPAVSQAIIIELLNQVTLEALFII